MRNFPKIKIKKDTNNEVKLFLTFLHHPYYPRHQTLIFQNFPDLKNLLKNSKNEKRIIKEFLFNFYDIHKNKIDKIIKKSELLIQKNGKSVLKNLSNLMDYQWSKSIIYYAIPTILPFSPFGTNKFYFSILGQIYNKSRKNILFIASHEISHFIFYDFLKKIEQKIKKSVPDDLKNYFKEALAAVLLNRKPLCNILDLHKYEGNPEIRDLQIKKPNGAIISFVQFIDEYYRTAKEKNKKSFENFLEEILNIFLSISKEFSKKRIIWNRYGKQLLEKPKALHLYQKPIQIKKE